MKEEGHVEEEARKPIAEIQEMWGKINREKSKA